MSASKRKNSQQSIETLLNTVICLYIKQNLSHQKTPLKELMNRFEKEIIITAIDLTNGHQKTAAAFLGLNTTTLNEKIKRYGIDCSHQKGHLLMEKLEKKMKMIEQ